MSMQMPADLIASAAALRVRLGRLAAGPLHQASAEQMKAALGAAAAPVRAQLLAGYWQAQQSRGDGHPPPRARPVTHGGGPSTGRVVA